MIQSGDSSPIEDSKEESKDEEMNAINEESRSSNEEDNIS